MIQIQAIEIEGRLLDWGKQNEHVLLELGTGRLSGTHETVQMDWMPVKSGMAQGDKERKETPEEIMLLCLAPERNALMLSSEVEVSRFWVVEMG